jgi:hypothetical protein
MKELAGVHDAEVVEDEQHAPRDEREAEEDVKVSAPMHVPAHVCVHDAQDTGARGAIRVLSGE